ELRASRENSAYLPGVNLPEAIGLTSDLHSCADDDLIAFGRPSTPLRDTAARLAEDKINSNAVLLSCIKGIEHGTGKRMSEILAEIFPQHTIAVLSGPNLAAEVSRELPTATVLACTKRDCAAELQKYLGTPRFRIYTGEELVGIELGGALKNVVAIAAGAGDGLGLGDNSKAALITRGIVEIRRLGVACGADAETFSGLSGLGDLTVTCYSRLSRNRMFGDRLGRGERPEGIVKESVAIAEGYPTARSAYRLAQK